MIQSDQQLALAQEAVRNLEQVLIEARKHHSASEYRVMSEPILMEIQQRQQDILDYLSRAQPENAVA